MDSSQRTTVKSNWLNLKISTGMTSNVFFVLAVAMLQTIC